MSFTYTHYPEVVVESGKVLLRVKGYDNNLRPHPSLSELQRRDYSCLLEFPVDGFDPLHASTKLEELARSYDSGCIREGFGRIGGPEAYSRWAGRMRRAGFPLPDGRGWKCLYDPLRVLLCERTGRPALVAGTPIGAQDWEPYKELGLQFKSPDESLAKYYIGRSDGCSLLAKRSNARRGWFAPSGAVLVQGFPEVDARPMVKSACFRNLLNLLFTTVDAAQHASTMIAALRDYYLIVDGETVYDGEFRNRPYSPRLFTRDAAEEAIRRAAEAFPGWQLRAIPAQSADFLVQEIHSECAARNARRAAAAPQPAVAAA